MRQFDTFFLWRWAMLIEQTCQLHSFLVWVLLYLSCTPYLGFRVKDERKICNEEWSIKERKQNCNCNENLMKHMNKMEVPKKNTFRKSIPQWALKLQNWEHKMSVSEMNKTNNIRIIGRKYTTKVL
jgi:hypothetical protein